MRLLIQRVSEASVSIEGESIASIEKGMLVLLGIEERDTMEDVEWLVQKLVKLRIFSDDEGKMNQNIEEINGDILLVSQFTLHAQVKKGNRPSFVRAARPEVAIPLYRAFQSQLEGSLSKPIKTGIFGAMMQVQLINDGPVTIMIDSQNRE